MTEIKNAFNWRGEPSIYSRDKKLKQIAAGQILGQLSRDRIAITEKKEFTIYARAKLKRDS